LIGIKGVAERGSVGPHDLDLTGPQLDRPASFKACPLESGEFSLDFLERMECGLHPLK
jgi:hypothetical protein